MDRRIDMAVAGSFAVVGAVLIYMAQQMRIPAYVRDPLTPRGLPLLLGGFLIVAAGVLVVRRLLIWGRQSEHVVASDGRDDEHGHPASAFRAIGLWFGLVAYAWAIPRLGYLLATAVAVAGMLWATEVRRPSRLVPLSIGIPVVTYLLFGVVLNLNLPLGILRGVPFL